MGRLNFAECYEADCIQQVSACSILLNRFAMTVMNPIVDLLKRRKQLSPNENPHDLISYVMLKKAEEFSTKSAGAFPVCYELFVVFASTLSLSHHTVMDEKRNSEQSVCVAQALWPV